MNDTYLREVGQRVRDLRKKRGFTQRTFAEKVKKDQTTISALEKGKISLTPLLQLAICELFGVREEWLLSGEGPEDKQGAAAEVRLYREEDLRFPHREDIDKALRLNPRYEEIIWRGLCGTAKHKRLFDNLMKALDAEMPPERKARSAAEREKNIKEIERNIVAEYKAMKAEDGEESSS